MKNKTNIAATAAVSRIRPYKSIYKYLTYENGIKMLSLNNLQFTRANKLNDKQDCHFSKINFDYIIEFSKSIDLSSKQLIEDIINKHKEPISSFGICSLGISADNITLWDRYTKTNELCDGICIELDLNAVIKCFSKMGIKVAALKVDYFDNIINSIPYKLYLGNEEERFLFLHLLFASKLKEKWREENEIRLFLPDELTNEYQRYQLYKSCFKAVYLGKEVTNKQVNEINKVIDDNKLKVKIHTNKENTKENESK